MVRIKYLATALIVSTVFGGPMIAAAAPETVSPGSSKRSVIVEASCPTFSWGAVAGTRSWDLVVYTLADANETPTRVVAKSLPGSALSWTPSLASCLERGSRYAWSVRSVQSGAETTWSSPRFFKVATGPSPEEFETALRLVKQYVEHQQAAPFDAATEAEAEAIDPESRAQDEELAVSPSETAAVTTQMSVDGGIEAAAFMGPLECTGCVSQSELDFDPATQAELNTHSGMNGAHHDRYTDAEAISAVTIDLISPTTTKGDLLVETGSSVVRLPVGRNRNSLFCETVSWA